MMADAQNSKASDRLVSKEELKLEDTKLLRRIEELHDELTSEIEALRSVMKELQHHKHELDETDSSILSELREISLLLQKLNQEQEYTRRIIQAHEKSLDENRMLIHEIQDEIQKIKSVLRVD